jgi:hypothetical protein
MAPVEYGQTLPKSGVLPGLLHGLSWPGQQPPTAWCFQIGMPNVSRCCA